MFEGDSKLLGNSVKKIVQREGTYEDVISVRFEQNRKTAGIIQSAERLII